MININKSLATFFAQSSRLRNSPSDTFAEVVIVHLSVPKQATASNDCAIFMLHNMKMIYQNPEDFIGRVLTNNLGLYLLFYSF